MPRALPSRVRGCGAGRTPSCAGFWVLLLLLTQVLACALTPATSASRNSGSPRPSHPEGWVEKGEYELVSPYEVDHKGAYVSHKVAHPHRRKRTLARHLPDALHLRLTGFRQEFLLDLTVANSLVVPGLRVHTLGQGGRRSVRPFPPDQFCFYQGSLRSHGNSSVALSTCTGLSGMIRTPEADYFLRPLPAHLATGGLRAPGGPGPPSHILYKRSTAPRASATTQVLMSQRVKATAPQPHVTPENPEFRTPKPHFCGRRRKYMPRPPLRDIFILPDEYTPHFRPRRSLPRSLREEEHNVETLVVVDKQMVQNHGQENVTTYVLTILNMVSSLFKDGTIGGNINIAIVGLILLEEEQPGLVISHHADHTLTSFCQWQSGLQGMDGRRHDHAILLTGLDICSWKDGPCDTLGFAPIRGMCSKYRSCTINEDTGLSLAFTVAHESGHNFGMVHDGEGNVCRRSEGNIMSPTLAGRNGLFSWSPCSRQDLRRFLSSAQALCLADQPQPMKQYKYPEKLPGQLYDANTQCKWQFGEKAKVCLLGVKKDLCKALWCHRVGRKCETKFMPAAEGTSCGHDMWCRGGQCVKYGARGPLPTDGHWSDWSSWSPCSRTCGGGVSHRDRLCSNPKPSAGGKFCEGSTRVLKLCNNQQCPQGSMDFRALQCAEHNSKKFRGWLYTWKPYTQVPDQDLCKLYCIAEGFDFFFSLSNQVQDGTPCSENSRNVCVDGRCEKVGCDNVLGSDAVEDSCGICKGNNSECVTHKGLYIKQLPKHKYYTVLTIPAGARNIRVHEVNASSSYLAVRNALYRYHLNGQWAVDWPGCYKFSGTTFEYRRSDKERESLKAPGPTNETLIVELLVQGRNPGIGWEYSVPRSAGGKPHAQPSYSWVLVRSECSVSCGGGYQTTREHCYRDLRVPVNMSFCNPALRPLTGMVPCRVSPCPPSWSLGNWSSCSLTCGRGTQSRPVQCVRQAQHRALWLPEGLCPLPVPSRRQACQVRSCPPTWSTGPWTECSRICGKGLKNRSVACRSSDPAAKDLVLSESLCAPKPKPSTHEPCLRRRCIKPKKLQWLVSAWSQCSSSCALGSQQRVLWCAEKQVSGQYRELPPKHCWHLVPPALELGRACSTGPCPPPPQDAGPLLATWHTSPWSQCSASCGGGVRSRSVQCLQGGQPAPNCLLSKPAASIACNTHFCPVAERTNTFCKDLFPWCPLVPQHGMCAHQFYGQQCCWTCSKSIV
ncbi:A disintegrin and metalloproteinase with thrombospondin motifs 16 [Suncus etruscus]|uniref:A disintegrin and metalloproteinase with thrombospondin motifs 16 n=1 Tax=Suncus etruscus TaxID=109475 RepID=UPI00210F5B70|nr:A disintegrin and metalloproteinase with thrombospondin motifs 16 [Suncus etruscus]